MFTYKMVQIPPNISVNAKANKNGIAAQYLEEVGLFHFIKLNSL